MKKLSVKNLLLLLIAYFCISCESQIESDVKEELSGEFKIEVIDAGFGNVDSKADTKTEEQGYKTNFSQGDEIGVFIINTTKNSIEYNNEKITFDGVSWSGDLRDKGSNMKFYAYYPYDADININNVAGSDVESFFASYVGTKQLVTDQSDYSDYTKADIMIGEGTVANNIVTFEMKHQMSLVVIKLPEQVSCITEYYLTTDPDYRWQRNPRTVSATLTNIYFSGFVPYEMAPGEYRYIVPSNYDLSSNTLSGSFTVNNSYDRVYTLKQNTLNVGEYKLYNITASIVEEMPHVLTIGDIFQSDGGLISQTELSGSGVSAAEKADCVGIVFQTYYENNSTTQLTNRIGNAEIQELRRVTGDNQYLPHGLVMALKDAGTNIQWSTQTTTDTGIPNADTEIKQKADINGLENNQIIRKISGYQTTYPAFNVAQSFNATIPQNKTTGWYLPSIGQLMDFVINIGELDYEYNKKTLKTYGIDVIYYDSSPIPNNIRNMINSKIEVVGGGNYDMITDNLYYYNTYTIYWSSTEGSIKYVTEMDFRPAVFYFGHIPKDEMSSVRSVLAF